MLNVKENLCSIIILIVKASFFPHCGIAGDISWYVLHINDETCLQAGNCSFLQGMGIKESFYHVELVKLLSTIFDCLTSVLLSPFVSVA